VQNKDLTQGKQGFAQRTQGILIYVMEGFALSEAFLWKQLT